MIRELATTRIDDLDRRPTVLVRPHATLGEAVDAIRNGRRSAALVVDDYAHLRGLITEADVMRHVVSAEGDWREIPVTDVMTAKPVSVNVSASLAEVVKLLQAKRFRRVPLVDDKGRGIGIFSVRDVVNHVADLFPSEFANLPPDPDHEASGLWGG